MEAKVIAVWYEKGGGGKTTTAFNLAAGLARKEKKVLLVDIDPTAGSTKHAGLTPNTLQQTLVDPLLQVVRNLPPQTERYLYRIQEGAGFDLLPANEYLDAIEDTVKKVFSGNKVGQALGRVLDPMRGACDFIIIDCAPGTRVYNTSALIAADEVIMPMRANFLDFGGLDDATDMIAAIKELNPALKNRGVLLTHYRKVNHTAFIEEGLECLKEQKGVDTLKTRISHSVDVSEASMRGISIYSYKKSGKQAKEYEALVEEILNG